MEVTFMCGAGMRAASLDFLLEVWGNLSRKLVNKQVCPEMCTALKSSIEEAVFTSILNHWPYQTGELCCDTSTPPDEKLKEEEEHEDVFISIQAFPALLDVSSSCEIRAVSCGSRHTAAVTSKESLPIVVLPGCTFSSNHHVTISYFQPLVTSTLGDGVSFGFRNVLHLSEILTAVSFKSKWTPRFLASLPLLPLQGNTASLDTKQ